MLKGRALRGVKGSAQRASVLPGGGGEYDQQRWGSGPQGHVKAVPCPLTSESLYRPSRHNASQQMKRAAVTVPAVNYGYGRPSVQKQESV